MQNLDDPYIRRKHGITDRLGISNNIIIDQAGHDKIEDIKRSLKTESQREKEFFKRQKGMSNL